LFVATLLKQPAAIVQTSLCMKTTYLINPILPLLLFYISSLWPQQLNAQRALRQLESWAGTSINSYAVPAPSAPSGSSNNTYRNPFVKTYEQKQAEASDHYQKALKAFNSRDWDDAVRQLNKAVRKDPYNQFYKDKLREAESALARERQQNKEYQDRLKREEEERRKAEEERKRQEQLRLEKERREQEIIKEKLNAAKETVVAFKKDIKYAQGHLKNYTKALASNSGELDKWATELDDMNKKLIDETKSYAASMFIKYALLKGVLKQSYVQALYKRTGNLSNSANPEIQKWFAKELKKMDVRVDQFQRVADILSADTDASLLLLKDEEEAGDNLNILLLMNSLFESAQISKYDNLVKQEMPFGLENMPGEYFEQAKMIGTVVASLGSTAFSWYNIRKLNISNEEMAQKVALYAAGMEQRMKEVDCLEKCIKRNSANCLEECTGKTKLSTPPPPLLFNYRNW
jgi:hypothetical protein